MRLLKSKVLTLSLLAALAGTLVAPAALQTKAEAATIDEQRNIAAAWSPILYQDIGGGPQQDIPTLVDFDGDWSTNNNWENIDQYGEGGKALYPWVYYSFVSSKTHWYIGYYFYYAKQDVRGVVGDLGDTFGDHENDMESMMLVIRKPGGTDLNGRKVDDPNGKLETMFVARHKKLRMYSSPWSTDKTYVPARDTVYYDGKFNMSGAHPKIYSAQNDSPFTEAEQDFGHALRVYDDKGAKGNSGIVFKWGGHGVQPQNMNQPGKNYWGYKDDFKSDPLNYGLMPVYNSLWPHRNDKNPNLWSSYGTFAGNNGSGEASAPWGRSFENYRDLGDGTLLTDPARFVDTLFDGLGEFSREYVTNDYR